jgi:phage terminase large subunit-like protein
VATSDASGVEAASQEMSTRNGKQVSQKWHKLLMGIPGYDPFATAGDCWFDEKAAEWGIGFFEVCCVHVKGKLAGQPFKLEPWQKAIVANLFGWKNPDGTRRYTECFFFVPRKNGKSTFGAVLALILTGADGEAGAEVYSAAAGQKQAELVFDTAKQMVRISGILKEKFQPFQYSITHESSGSAYKVIASKVETLHGLNTHGLINDELHAHPNRELVDVLETSTGSREQPLVVHLTTSDYEREGSICNDKHKLACEVRDNKGDPNAPGYDPEFLPVIYEASIEDDWTDEEVWAKANPNLGVSLSLKYLRRKCAKAKESPAFENTFKRLHLNIRTEQAVRWMPMDKWDACAGAVDAEALRGRQCYGGLDLATTSDATALALLFPDDNGGYDVLMRFWMPEATARERQRKDKTPYTDWIREGLITPTGGLTTDYHAVRRDINELADTYALQELAIDRLFQGKQLMDDLGEQDGLPVLAFGQGFLSMASPTRELYELVLSGKMRHGGNSVLRWMASNVSVETDAAGNWKPSKKASTQKIDGVVAVIMALGRASLRGQAVSVYDREERGLIEI